ncbi:GNAT family N-acetyltransferase [Aquimarina pacifica]|uniref:GNAT family N-acetyltransferase n=1 Tax=Aquimarina pacifica TaxID=1296415 RepID=UPI000472E88E|nr:GNAT family N-acetyltransferase [Aquimarina pacifica]
MVIEKAQIEDLPEILELQKKCYVSEARIYQNFDIAPLTQTLESIINDYNKYVFLKIQSNGFIIGSVRAILQKETCSIEKLIVHENFQNRGLGKQLIFAIENYFKQATYFSLFTGHKSIKNIALYKKIGYTEYKRKLINDDLELVFLSKHNKN